MGVGGIFGSEVVQGAGCARAGTFHDVEVDHGGGDVGMAEEVLNGADVRSGFEEMGGDGMAKEWRSVWEVMRLGMEVIRTASRMWRAMESSWRWWRANLPVRGWGERVAEGNISVRQT
jgi:hypothetical protein